MHCEGLEHRPTASYVERVLGSTSLLLPPARMANESVPGFPSLLLRHLQTVPDPAARLVGTEGKSAGDQFADGAGVHGGLGTAQE